MREFRTFTAGLRALRGWLAEHGATQVAMEATGVYWKPVWHVLEAETGWELLLTNAQHVKNLPGRKTDVADSVWLCQLLECGLLRGSFIPPKPIAQLRDLTRYRKKLVEERTRETQRIQKLLEDAGIKLDSVVSDVLGKSARAMLEALINGERDVFVLAELAQTRMRPKIGAAAAAARSYQLRAPARSWTPAAGRVRSRHTRDQRSIPVPALRAAALRFWLGQPQKPQDVGGASGREAPWIGEGCP